MFNPNRENIDRDRLTEQERKDLASLKRSRYRKRHQAFLVEGIRSVESALKAEAPLLALLVSAEAGRNEDVERILNGVSVPVYRITDRDAATISDVQTDQGLMAVARMDFKHESALPQNRSILALDAVQDPGNVGTIIRTAAWFGIDAVVAGAGTVDLFNPKVVRSSMGGIWDVDLYRTGSLEQIISQLRSRDYKIYGADLSGRNINDWEPAASSVLILGSEAHGLSPEMKALLDERILIPGNHGESAGVESLNIAVAAGILMQNWSTGNRIPVKSAI